MLKAAEPQVKYESKIDFDKSSVVRINPKYGHAILPQELDFKEDEVYDKLYK